MEIGTSLTKQFADLFGGIEDPLRPDAFGTGKGEWIKRPLTFNDFHAHLAGQGSGIGLPPLRKDNTCWFAAIDLDEPDFEAALAMQEFLPGSSWIERSRSGNAHVWVFFSEPIEAWVPMGILREATIAAGKKGVEVFPKNHDFSKVKLGSYINLPYHGGQRPILVPHPARPTSGEQIPVDLELFVEQATLDRNSPDDWRKRAQWLLIDPPESRTSSREFGTQSTLHMCAEHIIANCETNPVVEGHRAMVFFCLAKQLTNCELYDHDEALGFLREVNRYAEPPTSDSELKRILGNAEHGQYTSTGCDDPLMAPYVDPSCKIAQHGTS